MLAPKVDVSQNLQWNGQPRLAAIVATGPRG
jgi:hypothetical protein